MPQLMLGQLVRTTAGRDKGRFMLIIGIVDENYVHLVDGDLRRVENPKKKKIKHLKLLGQRAEDIALKLQNKRKIYNEEVNKALKELMDASLANKASSKI